ncbi:MAG: ABC transporter permease [Deltaproteobacteria bacterium]|nr:ABC transporter permease [Deltaproteobacteria bacterium]
MGRLVGLAARNLARNRRRTLLTLAALAVGVMAVVGVRGFLNGLQGMLIGGVAEGTIGPVLVHRTGYLQSMESNPLTPNILLTPDLLARLRAVPGVTAVSPRLGFAGMASVGDETVFAIISAVDESQEPTVCPRRREYLAEGDWLQPGRDDAVMGMEIARGVGAKAGARLALISGDAEGVMNAVDVTVRGFSAAAAQMERRSVVIPLRKGQELLRLEGRATEIALGVTDLSDVEAVRDRVAAVVGPGFEVSTWKDVATTVRDVQATQNAALDLITFIFMAIMLMGIANTLLMSVLERVREIGTMLAVGTRRRQILGLFLWEALMLGVLGATLGALLGFGVVQLLAVKGVMLQPPGASLPQKIIPVIHVVFMVRMVALSAAGAAVAAVYPAWKAAGLRPVQALAAV